MKKQISFSFLSLAFAMFSLSANAQTQDPKEAGKADAKNLSEYVVINKVNKDKKIGS